MATLSTPSGSRRKTLSLDMTPMVDLAFLLLTFFVLTTSLNKAYNLKIEMPAHEKIKSKSIDHARAMTIVLGAENKIYWYMGVPGNPSSVTSFSKDGIRKVLIEKKKTISDLFVLIKPSSQSQYKNVIDILDEMIILEHQDYSIADLEPEDTRLVMRD